MIIIIENLLSKIEIRKIELLEEYKEKAWLKYTFDAFIILDNKLNDLYCEADKYVKRLIYR